MSTLPTLNELLFRVDADYQMGRNDVCFAISQANKGPGGVTPVETPGKLGLLQRLRGGENRDYVVVQAGRALDMPKISVECRDLRSEVPFTLILSFDLRTPAADEEEALLSFVRAFRGAELQTGSGATGQTAATSPAGILQAEMRDWLRKRYRKGSDLSDRGQDDWLETQSTKIRDHVAATYGLDADVSFKLMVDAELDLGPFNHTLTAEPSDSNVTVNLSFRAGTRLKQDTTVFKAAALNEAQFKSLMKATAERALREEVKLHDFRFKGVWKGVLEERLGEALAAYGRVLTGFHLESGLGDAGYDEGPHAVKDSGASFLPVGWEAEDAIHFRGDARIYVRDAALFEARFDVEDHIETVLGGWIRSELQSAIDTILHETRDTDAGYADLLENWEGVNGYRQDIEKRLAAEGQAVGLELEAIITQPDRPEMGLLNGVDVSFGAQELAAKDPGVTLNVQGQIKLKVNSFNDIHDVLNRTHDPLGHLRDQVILPALKHVARQTTLIDFYSRFEFVPENDAEQKDKPHLRPIKRQMEKKVRKACKAAGVLVEDFTLEQAPSHHWTVFKALTSVEPRKLEVMTRPFTMGKGADQTSEAYKIEFRLKITGVAEGGWSDFIPRDWDQSLEDGQTYYDRVFETVRADMGALFLGEDVRILQDYRLLNDNAQQVFQALVQRRLNKVLTEAYGLVGEAVNASRDLTAREKSAVADQEGDLALQDKTKEMQREAQLKDAADRMSLALEARHNKRKNEVEDFADGMESEDSDLSKAFDMIEGGFRDAEAPGAFGGVGLIGGAGPDPFALEAPEEDGGAKDGEADSEKGDL